MAESVGGAAPVFGGAFRGLAWVGGALATVAAIGIGAVLAVFFAATLAVIAVLGAVALGLTALAMRARRSVRSEDPDLIEAHHVGGQSWVAYGWDRNGR
jgi:hypothetical protein